MQKSPTNGAQAEERPAGRPCGQGGALWRTCDHLKLSGQVVSKHAHESECAICVQTFANNNVQGCVLLGLAKQLFLAATPVMERYDVFGRCRSVSGDNRILILKVFGDEQVELERLGPSDGLAFASENQPM